MHIVLVPSKCEVLGLSKRLKICGCALYRTRSQKIITPNGMHCWLDRGKVFFIYLSIYNTKQNKETREGSFAKITEICGFETLSRWIGRWATRDWNGLGIGTPMSNTHVPTSFYTLNTLFLTYGGLSWENIRGYLYEFGHWLFEGFFLSRSNLKCPLCWMATLDFRKEWLLGKCKLS